LAANGIRKSHVITTLRAPTSLLENDSRPLLISINELPQVRASKTRTAYGNQDFWVIINDFFEATKVIKIAISYQLSAISQQFSVISQQLSVISTPSKWLAVPRE
jgi:hypothetical protein